MPDPEPLIVKPDTVTVLAVPTFLSAKTPVAPAVLSVTVSPDSTPTRAAPATFNVAVVVRSYTLLLAVTPVTVSAFAVMSAEVAGWVSV